MTDFAEGQVHLDYTAEATVPRNVTHVRVVDPSVKKIPDYAFSGCQRLTSVELCEGVESIGNGAFQNCAALMHISAPSTITSIGESAFQNCPFLNRIRVPRQVKVIPRNTFSNCRRLQSVELPQGLQRIENAFQGCDRLINIWIPDSVDFIDPSAFARCRRLLKLFKFDMKKMIKALRNRFDKLPIHKLCYQQGYHETEETRQQIRDGIKHKDMSKIHRSVLMKADVFGFTPFHILSLSTSPNVKLFRKTKLSHSRHGLTKKDRWSKKPLDHILKNPDSSGNSTEAIKYLTAKYFLGWLDDHGVFAHAPQWRVAVQHAISSLGAGEDTKTRETYRKHVRNTAKVYRLKEKFPCWNWLCGRSRWGNTQRVWLVLRRQQFLGMNGLTVVSFVDQKL